MRAYMCFAVPENIECGSCLAGGVREMVVQVENTGGEARFSLRHPDPHKHQVWLHMVHHIHVYTCTGGQAPQSLCVHTHNFKQSAMLIVLHTCIKFCVYTHDWCYRGRTWTPLYQFEDICMHVYLRTACLACMYMYNVQPGSVLELGAFSVSPTEFHLTPNDATPLQVILYIHVLWQHDGTMCPWLCHALEVHSKWYLLWQFQHVNIVNCTYHVATGSDILYIVHHKHVRTCSHMYIHVHVPVLICMMNHNSLGCELSYITWA